ncbi:B-cell receptor CD22-like protein [Labeo rohita]|uniref:B-cell receptor CD22-like protein n=1 Tax=Labeo rohita TaxID=84645 RepID=A0A498LYI9_LABRO|nr:B-cell receptor CD22-like protein [Labeo rohita]
MFVGSGRIYGITKISSDHSGEYKCKSNNKPGEKFSDAVTLNVMSFGCPVILYISIGVVCGASVVIMMALIWQIRVKKRKDTQESQMNQPRPHDNRHQAPDVKLAESVYENVTYTDNTVMMALLTLVAQSEVSKPHIKIQGSGRIYSISKISSDHSGEYKCKSRNEHGQKDSDAVTLNVMWHLMIIYISTGVGCGAAVIITIVLIWRCMMTKRKDKPETQMNHSGPQDDRLKDYDAESTEPVYDTVTDDW